MAWIAQRKNALALLFLLISMYCYCKSDGLFAADINSPAEEAAPSQARSGRWYWLSLCAFVAALLSKGSVAILPGLLAVVIWWRREKIDLRDVLRLTPLLVLGVAFTLVNVYFQNLGLDEPIRSATWSERLAGSGMVIWFYLFKALLPIRLMFVYPQWEIAATEPLAWLPFAAVVCVSVALWWQRHVWWVRPLLVAWGWYCLALAPVAGLTDVYFMKYSLVADHYQYIALIAVTTLVGAALTTLAYSLVGALRVGVFAVCAAIVCALGILTWRQCGIYTDIVTLYTTTLAQNPDCWMAHNNLGSELMRSGNSEAAIAHYEKAIQLKPRYSEAENNFGLALLERGSLTDAMQHFQNAIDIRPNYAEAFYNLGLAHAQLREFDYAVAAFERAVAIRPNFWEALHNLGNVLYIAGRKEEAIEKLQQTIKLKPDFSEAYANLAVMYYQLNRVDEAIEIAEEGLKYARSQQQKAIIERLEQQLRSYHKTK